MFSRRIALVMYAAFAASITPSARANAQLEVARGSIEGHVHMPNDSAPVVGALVGIVGSMQQEVTNTRGEFHFGNIRPGRYEMRVRRLGMEPLVHFVTVGPGQLVLVS